MSTRPISGTQSLDVCKYIVENQEQISEIQVISHTVSKNWRQKYLSIDQKSKFISECFENNRPPSHVYTFQRNDFLNLELSELSSSLKEHEVLSLVSKVKLYSGETAHIAMINYHLDEEVSLDYVEEATNYICGRRDGFILNTGRYFHYYGNFIISEHSWRKFMAAFMLPCVIVSPGYMGHRLIDGYATLRLTTDQTYKPTLPKVVREVKGSHEGLVDNWIRNLELEQNHGK